MNDVNAPRPRRWWIALILNVIFPPIGYAYAGAWKTAAAAVALIMAGTVAANFWTLAYPPGVYMFGQNGVLYGALALGGALGVHAAAIARSAPARGGRPSRLALLYILPWAVLFVANLLYSAYGPHPTYVMSSGSMEPTLRQGDILIVDGARAECGVAGAKPGDVVVFRRPGAAEPLVHRIVAGPGQTVEMLQSLLVIDGKPVRRWALGSQTTPELAVRATEVEEVLPNGARHTIYDIGTGAELDNVAPVTVPPGAWYVMGDNRDNAADSRVFGPVADRDVCAVVRKIVWSKDKSRVGREP